MKQLLLYVPALHAGYERFLRTHSDAAEVLLVGTGFRALFPSLAKEIRALDPAAAARYLRAGFDGLNVAVIEPADLSAAITADVLVVPDEQMMREIVRDYELDHDRQVIYERTFLRWDRKWSLEARPVDYDGAVSVEEFAKVMHELAAREAHRSSDWWRQVGAAASRDGRLISVTHNTHQPTEYAPYVDGDPRNEFRRGIRSDLSTAIHAEALLIAQAAREGEPLAGADIYVTAFPCPSCARLIAQAGFRRCYFRGSYAVLDGAQILEAAGVQTFWIDTGTTDTDTARS